MKRKVITSADYRGTNKAHRPQYTILEFRWSDFSKEEQSNILKEADKLYKGAHVIAASTGLPRASEKKYIDSLSGVIAEYATTKFFNDFLNDNWKATRPPFTSTHNQVDIKLEYNGTRSKKGTYKVEVRSSFVQNGIVFALYAMKNDKTHFDVLGPYKQETYKKDFESIKDLFMRVLFDIKSESTDNFKEDRKFYEDRKYFKNKYMTNNDPFYIIGGMGGDKIKEANYTKTLTSKNLSQYASNIKPGEYHVAEISEISDIVAFSAM